MAYTTLIIRHRFLIKSKNPIVQFVENTQVNNQIRLDKYVFLTGI